MLVVLLSLGTTWLAQLPLSLIARAFFSSIALPTLTLRKTAEPEPEEGQARKRKKKSSRLTVQSVNAWPYRIMANFCAPRAATILCSPGDASAVAAAAESHPPGLEAAESSTSSSSEDE